MVVYNNREAGFTGCKRLLALTISDRRGASSRYRVYQHVAALSAAGYDVEIVPPMKKPKGFRRPLGRMQEECRFLARVREPDVVLIQKRLFTRWFIERLKRRARRIVFDFDDAIFTSPAGDWSFTTRRRVAARLDAVLHAATLTLAGNRFLAEFAQTKTQNVEVVPTAIDIARYRPCWQNDEEGFTLGWIGNGVNLCYLDRLRGVLSCLARELHNLRLVVVSDRDYSIPGVVVENRRWSEATEVHDVISFHVGLMPLDDTTWTRGKCAFKALQYMAAGVPTVCSAVGANVEVIEDRVDGFLCRSESEWLHILRRLAADSALRQRIGQSGRQKVERLYSTAVVGGQLVRLLGRLL